VKTLLKILAVALPVFLALAIIQEFEFFASSWFGSTEPPPELSEEQREAAGDAVYMMLSLMRHLYTSGGDSRFAERMPASDGIIDEMIADIEYLSRNHRRQDPELKRLQVTAVEPLAEDRVAVRPRELWSFRFLWTIRTGESDPPRIQVLHSRYLVVRDQGGWRVEAWGFDEPEEEPEVSAS
jgi:hypothetical protein